MKGELDAKQKVTDSTKRYCVIIIHRICTGEQEKENVVAAIINSVSKLSDRQISKYDSIIGYKIQPTIEY